MPSNFALCICTYKRELLLRLLLEDVTKQTIQPKIVIIVDGDPGSGEVLNMLKEEKLPKYWAIVYVPSNHGNQTYQRYLGYRLTKTIIDIDFLLYLDDDLRIQQEDTIENIISPLAWEKPTIAAVTGHLIMGSSKQNISDEITINDLRAGLSEQSWIVKLFGSKQRVMPGDVSPTGNRVFPAIDQPYANIRWLLGGSIAFRLALLDESILSDDFFAMNHLRYGLCEDLVIGRKMLSRGDLLYARNAVFHHPSETAPTAYSSDSFRFGYALAYSRRWFNDNYRGFSPPTICDRFQLLIYYLGSLVTHWYKAMISRDHSRFSFALGYSKGVFQGLTIKPTAKNLTPAIDWWQDAEEALRQVVIIQ